MRKSKDDAGCAAREESGLRTRERVAADRANKQRAHAQICDDRISPEPSLGSTGTAAPCCPLPCRGPVDTRESPPLPPPAGTVDMREESLLRRKPRLLPCRGPVDTRDPPALPRGGAAAGAPGAPPFSGSMGIKFRWVLPNRPEPRESGLRALPRGMRLWLLWLLWLQWLLWLIPLSTVGTGSLSTVRLV